VKELAIVVVAYNRKHALERCLRALSNAAYPDHKVKLVISIDGGESNQDVCEAASLFAWKYGDKEVICHSHNLGLRKHVMRCGNLSRKYGSIILLEDDIYVSPDFYNFALQALHYYRKDTRIAGISLYSPRFNESSKLPFEPLQSMYDVFFSQLPNSWGQVWTSEQWMSYTTWYKSQTSMAIDNFDNPALPRSVKKWPTTSWKKYYAKYMLEQNKYFVYPYDSLSTNFGDPGTHFRKGSSLFQVALSRRGPRKFRFDPFDSASVVYDSSYENIHLASALHPYNGSNITIDLYASKEISSYKRYALTTRIMDHRIIMSFDLSMRPIEENIIHSLPGTSIFLYDTSIKQKLPMMKPPIPLINYYSWDKKKRRDTST
jgi:glycosyltransferase involved in cell wall biosynthesis